MHLILSPGTRIVTRKNANRIGGQAVPAANRGGPPIPAGAVGKGLLSATLRLAAGGGGFPGY